MAISATAGAKLYISPTSVVPDTIEAMDEAAQQTYYEGISDWVEVEEVEDLGTVGDAAEAISFISIGDSRVRKIKGARDAGTQSIVVGRDPLADGQAAMVAAEKTAFNYPFKIELADAPSASYTDSVLYFAGMVLTRPTGLGQQNNVTRRTFDVGINTSVLEVSSEAIST